VSLDKKALEYHAAGRPGKVKVVPTTPCATADDLSLAYSPGVAAPCLAIEKDAEDAYKYTAKGNLVAVISNGTAVLGLGNIGALAGKPVMEGKGVLFKRFADIDVFDIEVDSQDTAEIIRFCEMIAPTFGGINLEDIRAPECFEIEEKLKASLDIPVFHDDQHGTAIISAAALLNALEIQEKKIDEVKIVFSGAGAAAISCAKLYKDIGVKAENILMCDSRGVMWKGRGEGYNKYKEEFVAETEARTLEDAMVGCDVFVGLSQKGLVTKAMVKSMANRPTIFAMANPDPEITPLDAKDARPDSICATGRSDYANQVNNVLGFPFIFRGALDVRASKINEEMKLAATFALSELAKRGEAVPEAVKKAYPGESFDFGPNYIIPKPFDPRVLLYVAPAVAKAAMDSGVARKPIDLKDYETRLIQTIGEIASL
jgi:malate dehydrogenase (oxaloacetate-decarboxylating)(NADP+)